MCHGLAVEATLKNSVADGKYRGKLLFWCNRSLVDNCAVHIQLQSAKGVPSDSNQNNRAFDEFIITTTAAMIYCSYLIWFENSCLIRILAK